MANDEVEERPVEKSELSAGVKLSAGHPVHLLVGGVKPADGSGDGDGGTTEPSDPTSDGSGEGSGEGGGSDDGDPTTAPGDDTGGDGSGGDGTAPSGGGTSAPPSDGGGTPPADDPGGGATDGTGGGTPSADDGGGTGTADEPPKEDPPKPPDATPSKKTVFDAAHFEADKAFPLPASLQVFRDIAKLAHDEPKRSLLVLGHTDAVGTSQHNLGLSGDRAVAVAAYLKNDADAWMKSFDGEPSSKKWGTREVQHMLHALPWGGETYLKRAPADAVTSDVRAAMARFQREHRLPDTATKDSTGLFDKASRKKLVEEYMAADGTTAPAPTKIATLACGPRHLKVNTKAANAENRRVEVLAFEADPFKPAVADYDGAQDKNDIYKEWLGAAKDLPKGSGGAGGGGGGAAPKPAPATPPPAPKPEPKPAPKPEPKPAPKPEPKPAPKPEPKPEPKPAPKPEPKPAPKPEPKPEPKPKPEPAPKLEPKPAPKPEPKPAPKPVPKKK